MTQQFSAFRGWAGGGSPQARSCIYRRHLRPRWFTCSVKRVVGVKDCGEEAKGEGADTEGHVKAGVAEALEHLHTHKRAGLRGRKKHTHVRTQTENSRRLCSPAPSSVPEAAVEFST